MPNYAYPVVACSAGAIAMLLVAGADPFNRNGDHQVSRIVAPVVASGTVSAVAIYKLTGVTHLPNIYPARMESPAPTYAGALLTNKFGGSIG
jgi:hypothetical protein